MADVSVNEWIVLSLCVCCAAGILLNRQHLERLPYKHYLLLAFLSFALGSVATVVEHMVWPEQLNLVEYVCYLLNGLMLMLWCHKLLFCEDEEVKHDRPD